MRGKSSEQILLSPYFGLDSTRAESTSTKLNELARSAVSGNRDASANYLKLMATGLGFDQPPSPPTTSAPKRRKNGEGVKK